MSKVIKIKGLDLTNTQRKIYDACKLDSPYTFIVVSSGRQIGKSTVASQVMCNWCFNNTNYKVGYYAPTYKQCKEQYRRLEKGLQNVDGIEFNKSELIVTFPNKSIIQFQTAENDNMRGSTYHSIIVDESGFVKGDIYNAGILPTVAVSLSANTGKVLLISTPKTKNWFFDMFFTDNPGIIAIKATSEEGGLISKEVLDQIKSVTPEHIYRNEYLAEFMEAGSGIFPYRNCVIDDPSDNHEGLVAGIDFGIENDYTVLAIMNNKGEVVHLQRWRGGEWIPIIDEIAKIMKRLKVNKAYAESNGIGNMPFKELRKRFPYTHEWQTTIKSKPSIINKLSADFQQELIKIPNYDFLLTELDAYELSYNPATGSVKYGARSGFNDDCVMALAIANYNRISASKRIISSR